MIFLDSKIGTVTVDCSTRLNELLNRFFKIAQYRENTWFNKKKKERLSLHMNKISRQVRRHVRKQHPAVVASVSFDRKFGTRRYTNTLIVDNTGEKS